MRYAPSPPYEILSTNRIDFLNMQRLKRFARYWDMVANSGRFRSTMPLILGDKPFMRFLVLSDCLYETTRQVSRIALKRLFELLHRGMIDCLGCAKELTESLLMEDYRWARIKGMPSFQRESGPQASATATKGKGIRRQSRHSRCQ